MMDHAEHGGKKDAEKEDLEAYKTEGYDKKKRPFEGVSFHVLHAASWLLGIV
jgi:hypothetical protein